MKKIKDILYILLIIVLCLTAIYPFSLFKIEVIGVSMAPNLSEGDIGYCDKVFYKNNLKRFDIVVVDRPEDDVIKRIIGLPNETIYYSDNILYVDSKPVEEKFISDAAKQFTIYDIRQFEYSLKNPIELGEDEYFIMGDNRQLSYDSRSYGPIKIDSIEGKLVYIKHNKKWIII